jgi:tight adherence protein B
MSCANGWRRRERPAGSEASGVVEAAVLPRGPGVTAAVAAAVAGAAAVLLLPRRGDQARRRLAIPRSQASVSAAGQGVAELAERLAGIARAGLPPSRIWALLAARPGPHALLAAAVLPWLHAGVPAGRALGALAGGAGRTALAGPQLSCLAAALDACERAGAPLAPTLDGLAAALRAQEEARRERETALAAPQATATVMIALPAVGLLLGAALGADPLAVLAGTPVGRAALVLGGMLWLAGRWWIRHLVAVAAAG